jgi:serine/threonine protein phosphatase PrpC
MIENVPRANTTGAPESMGPLHAGEEVCLLQIDGACHGPEIAVGYMSLVGRRERNEDYIGVAPGDAQQRITRGSVVALADGISGGAGARVAAEISVRGFLEAYYGITETLSPERAAGCALDSVNRWLYAQGRSDPALAHMAAAFAALILRGREAFLVSAGDVRLYRLRAGRLRQLSEDHVLPTTFGGFIARAPGLDRTLLSDFRPVDLAEHDRLLLCSDGLHRHLAEARVGELLATGDVRTAARELAEEAMRAGSRDNISVIVIDVLGLPNLDPRFLERVIGALPVLDVPKEGEVVDGFHLESTLYVGHYSRLFVAQDMQAGGERVVVKFPHPRIESDENIRRAFTREGWIAQRVRSPWIVEPQMPAPGRQSRLYMVMPYYAGETLEARLKRRDVSLPEGLKIAAQLTRAVDTLNRREIFHRDIKPENLMILEDGGLKLLDLGFAHLPGILDPAPPFTPGTPSYMAPELVQGALGDARSEVFACSVTLFRMFSGGGSPYGLRHRTPLQDYRPDLPAWLDRVLERAMDPLPERRHQDVIELLADLEFGAAHGARMEKPARRSLYERNPLLFWKTGSVILMAILFLVLAFRQ